MEVFEAERRPAEATALAAKLKALGLRGRDAAYLASIVAPPAEAAPERARYFDELAFMVPPGARPAVLRLLGIESLAADASRKAA